MTRKICVVTGSRADYGLLRSVMQGIKNDPNLIIQVIATGMHLSPTFGLTYKEIESDGFFIDEKVEVITEIEDIYRIIFVRGHNVTKALEIVEQEIPDSPHRKQILDFIRAQNAGIIRGI